MNNEPAGDTEPSESPSYLIAVAFVSGMAIMGLEMSSSRLMAPFFGTSLTIWTTIIGSTMIALTAGYYLGGVLADRSPRMSVLARLLFGTAVFILFVPYIATPVMDVTLARFARTASNASGHTGGSYAVIVPLVVCAALISAPAVILGMTSPFIIRLDSSHRDGIGRIAGKVFAFSTLGSILGTFLPALVLVPLVGTRFSFLFFGGTLLCVTAWSLRPRLAFVGLALLMFTLAALLCVRSAMGTPGGHLVLERETNYQSVRIYRVPVPDEGRGEGQFATFLVTDAGLGMQSMWIKGLPYTESWQDFFAVIPRIYEVCSGRVPERVLVIGLGGACAPYLITQVYPDLVIDGVEIDGGLIDAARPHFPFASARHLSVYVGDGRFFLRTTPERYDVIIVDAFRPPHIPFHLTTAEFFAQIRERLTARGVLAMNVGTAGEHRVFTSTVNTVASIFSHTYFGQYPASGGTGLFTNRFIVASAADLALDEPAVEQKVFRFPDPRWDTVLSAIRDPSHFASGQASFFQRIRFDPSATVLTDDRSALDLISEREFWGLTLGTGK